MNILIIYLLYIIYLLIRHSVHWIYKIRPEFKLTIFMQLDTFPLRPENISFCFYQSILQKNIQKERQHHVFFIYIIFSCQRCTLCSTYSRVGTGNLVIRPSHSSRSLNFHDITRWVVELNISLRLTEMRWFI